MPTAQVTTRRMISTTTYSVHAFDFTVLSTLEYTCPPPMLLVCITICEAFNYNVPAFYAPLNLGNYTPATQSFSIYKTHHSNHLAFLVSLHFPEIEPCCARAMIEGFEELLDKADTSRAEFEQGRVPFSRVHISLSYLDDVGRVIRESFEEAEAMVKAASIDSVNALLASEEGRMDEDRFDESCVICLDDIKVKCPSMPRLEMPCRHVFHKYCLLEWLKKSHVCPLCRYELAVELQVHK